MSAQPALPAPAQGAQTVTPPTAGAARAADALGPMRVWPVPDREPEPSSTLLPQGTPTASVAVGRPGAGAASHDQPQLLLVPGGRDRRGPLLPLPARPDQFSPRPTRTADLPAPRGWAAQMALMVMQVVTGVRQPTQLARFASPAVYESLLRRRAGLARRARQPVRPTRVRAVVLSEPRDGVVDASVVLFDGARARAVALRMCGLDGRWIVTDLVIG